MDIEDEVTDDANTGVTFRVGDKFASFEEVEARVTQYSAQHHVQFWKRDARTIEAARKRVSKIAEKMSPALKYQQIKFCCIHGGKKFSTSKTGERDSSTFKQDCGCCIYFVANKEGTHLEVRKVDLQHNHIVSAELFGHLPQQRRLPSEVEEAAQCLLQLQANKKLVREDLELKTNKVVTLKDLSNIAGRQKAQQTRNDVTSTVKLLEEKYSATVRLLTDEKQELRAIFFQDEDMKRSFDAFPEIIFIDATYKLLETRMSVFLVTIEDGNGQSEVVAVGLFANEDSETLLWFFETFKALNAKWRKIKVTMADKDLTERQVITQLLPDCSLQICAFHTLQTFRREVSISKLGITRCVQETTLDILQRMVYAHSEDEYAKLYSTLMLTSPKCVIDYFQSNWHPIHEEWVMGIKWSCGNFLNSTNNRAESINGKLKSVVDRHSSLEHFVVRFFSILNTMRRERNHKAATMVQKVRVLNSTDSAEALYCQHLTPYAFKKLEKQFSLSGSVTVKSDSGQVKEVESEGKLYSTTTDDCTCGFRVAMNLPCRHIFAVRNHFQMNKYDPALCAERWSADFYKGKQRIFLDPESRQVEPVLVDMQRTTRVLSSHQKFRKTAAVAKKIAEVVSESSMAEFDKKLGFLQDLLHHWMDGHDVAMVVTDTNTTAAKHMAIFNPTGIELSPQDPCSSEPPTAQCCEDSAVSHSLGNEPLQAKPPTEALGRITVPHVMRKCGRPKGHTLTVVGLRKKRKSEAQHQVPFTRLPIRDKKKKLLTWLVGEEAANAALKGKLIEEHEVEQRPELLHSGIIDENVDVNCIRELFTGDAWMVVTSTLQMKKDLDKWECVSCKGNLEDFDSVICDWCLKWYHLPCVHLSTKPKCNLWQCPMCKK